MKWNPTLNALAAVTYIGVLVSFLRLIETYRHDTPDTMIDGIAAISLFSFSAAVMGFLLFYHPLAYLIEGKHSEAIAYFGKTIGIFGVIVVVLLTLAFLQ